MSEDEVLLLQDEQGNFYAIPIYRLADAKLKGPTSEVKQSIDAASPSTFKIVGRANMPKAVRRAAYVTPNVTANITAPMPTA